MGKHYWKYKSRKRWVCENCGETTSTPTTGWAAKDTCPKAK